MEFSQLMDTRSSSSVSMSDGATHGHNTWTRLNSVTGTCINASYVNRNVDDNNNKNSPPPLQLVWRGSTPIDNLHISIKVGMAAAGISMKSSTNEESESVIGHCVIGLNRLCITAATSESGMSGQRSVAQVLMKDGLPLYNIDTRSMQVK